MFRLAYFLLFAAFALPACRTAPKQDTLTTTKWRLQAVISRPLVGTKRDSIPEEPNQKERVNITYQFLPTKKYVFVRGSQRDEGTWGISSDEKVLLLTSTISPSENSEFRVHTLHPSRLIVSTEHKEKQEILYFAPAE